MSHVLHMVKAGCGASSRESKLVRFRLKLGLGAPDNGSMDIGREPAGWLWRQIERRLLLYGGFVVVWSVVVLVWRPDDAALMFAGGAAAPLLDRSFRDQMSRFLAGALGEERVAKLLAPLQAEGFEVLHDLPKSWGGNIDHLVIGPTGVVAVETKAWRGRVYPARGGRLMCNGADRSAAIRQARAEAMEVKARLARAGIEVYVEAVIALTRTRLPRGPITIGGVNVIEASELPGLVRAHRARGAIDVAAAVDAVLARA